jgi:hypothetical protein
VTDGIDPLGTAVLLGTTVIATALAAYLFQRRDIGIGAGHDWLQPVRRFLPQSGSAAAPAEETP